MSDTRCLDCFRTEDDDDVNVENRKTWGLYPEDRGEVYWKPAVCDDCWEQRKLRAPEKPPFAAPRPTGHDATHRGERCLDCGEPGILAVDTLGTPRSGVVVYRCPGCGAEMDDWAMEDYRFEPDHEAAHEGAQCVCCGHPGSLEASPTVKRGENGHIAIYRCRACDGVVGDDDLAEWRWSASAGRAVAR